MPTLIFNPTNGNTTLPAPYGQILTPGSGVVVADTVAQVIAKLGGSDNLTRSGLLLTIAPAGSAITASAGGGESAAASWIVRAMSAGALPASTYDPTVQVKTATGNGALTVDGVSVVAGDDIWDKDDATGSQRGKFTVVSPGSPSSQWSIRRSQDASSSSQFFSGRMLEIGNEGTANGGEVFHLTNATFTLDTTTPTVARETGVVHIDDTQTITGPKSFAQLALRLWNAAVTFAASLTFNGTAARTVTVPDASFTIAQSGATPTGSTAAPSATAAPAFTGTAPAAAENLAAPAFSGTGMTAAGQVMTSTDNQTMAVNQCAGMWLICATHGPYMIASNTAVNNAPAVLTIYGGPPVTDAGSYKILTALTPAGTLPALPTAAHTHAAGTLAQV